MRINEILEEMPRDRVFHFNCSSYNNVAILYNELNWGIPYKRPKQEGKYYRVQTGFTSETQANSKLKKIKFRDKLILESAGNYLTMLIPVAPKNQTIIEFKR